MKIIIIAWRFNPDTQKETEIKINNEQKIILFFTPVRREDLVREENAIELTTLITNNKCLSENKIFVFLHQSQFAEDTLKKYSNLESENCHLFFIASAQDEIYKLIESNNNAKLRDNICTEDTFNKIWMYYETLTIESIKKKIINLLLPMAIDVQGISDATPNKKTEYLKEVLNEFNYHQIKIKLDKIKTESGSIEHLMPSLNFDSLERFLYNLSVVELEENNVQEIINNYFSLKSELFLPNWLQKIVEDFDNYINSKK